MTEEYKQVIIYLDCETTINGGKVFGPHPMHHYNKLVMCGWLDNNWLDEPCIEEETVEGLLSHINLMVSRGYQVCLVGHNLSFDIKYICRAGSPASDMFSANTLRSSQIEIWDTMVAEYLIEAQDPNSSLSLEGTAKKYKLPFVKNEEIAAAFERGEGADKVNKEELKKYLIEDVRVLKKVLEKQLEIVSKRETYNLFRVRMEARKQLIIAEMNGMRLNSEVLIRAMPKMDAELDEIAKELQVVMGRFPGTTEHITLDLTSPAQLNKYLFGGDVIKAIKVPRGLYKNGKVKYGSHTLMGTLSCMLPWVSEKSRSTDEELLRELLVDARVPIDVSKRISKVLEYRNLSKELSTYCTSLLKHDINGFIHANINCTVTATGRLSSSKPNLQNIKSGPLKAAFTSRHEDGKLVEIDFSQIEIIAFALLTKDPNLLSDIVNGVDIHTALYIDMYRRTPTIVERKAFKPLTFGLIYGSGIKGLSINAKVSMSTARGFRETFFKRYPQTQKWQEDMVKNTGGKCRLVGTEFRYIHTNPTGLRLCFYTKDGVFIPTKLVNYPVQSYAADFVLTGLTPIGRLLYNKYLDKALLVNVVHDSYVFDCRTEEVARNLIDDVGSILSRMPDILMDEFGIDVSPLTEFKVGCSIGNDWFNMKELSEE